MGNLLSDADAANFLNVRFGAASPSLPTSFWVALSTTEPTDAGANVTEPGGSYARVQVTRNTTNFPTTTTRTISNAVAFTYPTPGTGDDWGVIGWYALYDASTVGTGNFRGWGRWDVALHVVDGDTAPQIPVGALVFEA